VGGWLRSAGLVGFDRVDILVDETAAGRVNVNVAIFIVFRSRTLLVI
jgi:hypothetical protein